jgi:hypothetical protein
MGDKKLDKINENLTGFLADIVLYIQKVWKFIEAFITGKNVLWEGQNDEATTAAEATTTV